MGRHQVSPKPDVAFDPQQMVVNLLAVKYLQQNSGQTIILSMKEMQELAKFTVRLEIIQPQDPANSPIKCTVITMAEAIAMMKDLEKAKGNAS